MPTSGSVIPDHHDYSMVTIAHELRKADDTSINKMSPEAASGFNRSWIQLASMTLPEPEISADITGSPR